MLVSSFAVLAQSLTGVAIVQLLAGQTFRFSCGAVAYGYGQFDRRGSAWAAFRYSSDGYGEPERRASATVRTQGSEVCFTIIGLEIAGEICTPVKEQSPGIYRFGTKDDWCDVQIIQQLPPHIDSLVRRN
jgi:hypothetical protein